MTDLFLDLRLRDFQLFERLVHLGSIAEVAEELGVPKATASRWLLQMEQKVGKTLFERTSRGVVLTKVGKEWSSHVSSLLKASQSAQVALHSTEPGGTLRISVPVPLGRLLLGPVIGRFRQRLPSVRLEFSLQNEQVDLLQEGFDLAIRGGVLADSTLLVRRLARTAMWLYASHRFRRQLGEKIPLILAPGDEKLLKSAGMDSQLGPAMVVVDDRTAVSDALIWGAGAGLLPSFLGEPACEEGSLFRWMEEPLAFMPVHALYHRSQRDDVRLQILIEEMALHLQEVLQVDGVGGELGS